MVATDLNPRALELAALSFELSQVDVELRHGSLFEPVGDERFDLIVSNPPYVMAPPESDCLTYRQAGLAGDQLTETLIRQAPRHLNPGGSMQLLTNWAVVESQDWRERLASWVEPTGCDAWIIERERLDRFDYIEMWLTDAGLAGTPQWRDHYQRWLTYFNELGIHEVGMGWILLTHAGRQQPHVRIESWPHQVAQPVAEMFSRHRDALDAALLAESELLTLRPRLHRVAQEAIGDPGASDPRHIVLRQQTGLLRGMEVSTVTGAVLGALDGDLSVGVVIQAVAELLEIPVDQVAAEALPLVRQTLEEQYLIVGPI